MTSLIQEIFNEYTQMRENGLDAQEALRALRAYVEPLTKAEREQLAQSLRAWERKRTSQQHAVNEQTPPPPAPAIKSLPKLSPKPSEQRVAWVECRHCGKKNRVNDVFCYSCGQILETAMNQFDTRTFAEATSRQYSDAYFGPDTVLVINVRDSSEGLELRPQLRNHEMVIGRITGNSAMSPDVDLSPMGAAELGVSRLHLALRYEASDNTIQIYDLGSANGSYINGQKLHPKELRVLRHGDELRLGRLVLHVRYLHPGPEIDDD
ncbi:MAG: FHA domain-containing protein [Anaerolineae bacterium]|nr:FHA domain-containing protein [Anaerolineae bacterium]